MVSPGGRCTPRRTATCERAAEQRQLGIQAAVSIGVAIGIMVLMALGPRLGLGMESINRLALIPATFIQVWAGGRFVRVAVRAARHGTVTMDTLVAIGTTAAWGYSVVVTLWPEVMVEAGLEPAAYFDSSTIIIGLILAGRWLEARARSSTAGAVRALMALQPQTAHRIDGDPVPWLGGRGRRPGRAGPARRPAAGPGRRDHPGRRRDRRGRLERRRVDDHGRVDARGAGRRATRSSARPSTAAAAS